MNISRPLPIKAVIENDRHVIGPLPFCDLSSFLGKTESAKHLCRSLLVSSCEDGLHNLLA